MTHKLTCYTIEFLNSLKVTWPTFDKLSVTVIINYLDFNHTTCNNSCLSIRLCSDSESSPSVLG